MGRIIRSTVTITITETWTITWTTDEAQADNTAPLTAATVVPDQPKPRGESDATMLPAVTPGPTDTQPLTCPPSQVQAVSANAPVGAVAQGKTQYVKQLSFKKENYYV